MTAEQVAPPNAREVEKHIIGAMLLGDTEALQFLEKLTSTDFFLEKHSTLWASMQELHKVGSSIDLVTVREFLTRNGTYGTAGGEDYLLEISSEVVSSAGLDSHCGIVREMSTRREYIRAAQKILTAAQNTAMPMDAVDAVAENAVSQAGGDRQSGGLVSARDCLVSTIDLIEKSHSGELQGLKTQFNQFNYLTGGLCAPDWIVLAGRPAVGKTAFALDVADYLATDKQKSVLVFSLEMTKEQLMQRLICRREGIDFQALRTGRLPRSEFQKIRLAVSSLKDSKLFIDDSSVITPARILSMAKRHRKTSGLDMIVIDNLSLMRGDRRSENRLQEVSELTRTFKGFGKILGVPILTLVHLSRAIEGRGEEAIPRKSDLRECGSIEQDADMIIAMHKPDIQGTKVDLHLLKQRNGPEGVVSLTSDLAHMRFLPYEAANGFANAA